MFPAVGTALVVHAAQRNHLRRFQPTTACPRCALPSSPRPVDGCELRTMHHHIPLCLNVGWCMQPETSPSVVWRRSGTTPTSTHFTWCATARRCHPEYFFFLGEKIPRLWTSMPHSSSPHHLHPCAVSSFLLHSGPTQTMFCVGDCQIHIYPKATYGNGLVSSHILARKKNIFFLWGPKMNEQK